MCAPTRCKATLILFTHLIVNEAKKISMKQNTKPNCWDVCNTANIFLLHLIYRSLVNTEVVMTTWIFIACKLLQVGE